MRRFVLGDIHGEYEYLKEVLKKSGFDYGKDLLIQIGDIVDRGPEPFKCMDELLKIKNLILIMGNHDAAFIQYTNEGIDFLGSDNGTDVTIDAWKKLNTQQKIEYQHEIFNKQKLYHITHDNIMFVHGGFDRWESLDDIPDSTFYWDRELITQAMSCKGKQKLKTLYDFKKIFLGHTPTLYWGKFLPIYAGGVWNVDTGSGKGGPLTIMDIDTEEYWQSDFKKEKFARYGIIEETKKDSSKGEKEESYEEYKEAA